MVSRPRLLSRDWLVVRVALCGLLGCLVLAAGGCSNTLTPSQRVEKELKALGKSSARVYPFGGKVTVDGFPAQRAAPDERVIVILFDRAHPDLPVADRPHAECDPRGEFSFSTYGGGDGVEPGEYVVTFARLSKEKGHNYSGPDGFQNLYNDPEQNGKKPEFTVKHAAPGKSDYVFDLKLAGQEPMTTPGPLAVTQIRNRND